MATYDVIVLGGGGVGSAAAMQGARRGLRTALFEQYTAAHDRGSSHGQTRIIRRAYFEHPSYVPLVERSFELWRDLEESTGRRLFEQVGLLQIGPPNGHVLQGVLESARLHGLTVEEMAAGEVRRRFPMFGVPDDCGGVYEAGAGYLRVEDCVAAHLSEAQRAGAELYLETPVVAWQVRNGEVQVTTSRGTFVAPRLIVAAGAWSTPMLRDLGIPLVVRRKPVYWLAAEDESFRPERGCPTFLFELPTGVFYGFPDIAPWGVKVAEHTGGETISDPAAVSREFDEHDWQPVQQFVRQCLPQLPPRVAAHSVCL